MIPWLKFYTIAARVSDYFRIVDRGIHAQAAGTGELHPVFVSPPREGGRLT